MPSITLTDPTAHTLADAGLIATNNGNLRTLLNSGLDGVNLKGNPALVTGEVPVWNSSTNQWDRSSVTKISSGSLATGIAGPPGAQIDHVEFTAPVTVSATVEASANTVVTGSSVAYDGATAVIIEFYAPYSQNANAAGAVIFVTLWEDSTDIGRLGVVGIPAGATAQADVPLRFSRKRTPSNASHTYSVRAFQSGGNGSVGAGAGGTGAYMPGFIRITKA